MFSKDEIERYKRHLVLKEIGGAGQKKLAEAKVLIIGAGGLGAPVALYLAAAGVGTLGIIDDDTVALSNLQRQILYTTNQLGTPKVDNATDALKALNPHAEIIPYNRQLNAQNALKIIPSYDIVTDGSDNFATRYLVNDACYFARRPLVSAAVGPFDGQLTTFKAYEKNENGDPNPNYRCLFPESPIQDITTNCSDVGILGSVAGVMGTLQATEVLKEIIGIGDSLVGKLITYDAKQTRFATLTYAWDPENPLNGQTPKYHDLSHHQIFK